MSACANTGQCNSGKAGVHKTECYETWRTRAEAAETATEELADRWHADTDRLVAERDAALARVKELEKTADYSVTHLKYQARIAELEGALGLAFAAMYQTHTNYCYAALNDRGLHAPECLAYEAEQARAVLDR